MNFNSSTETAAKCFWKNLITASHPFVCLPSTTSETHSIVALFNLFPPYFPSQEDIIHTLLLHNVISLFQSLEMKRSPPLLPQPSRTSCKGPLVAHRPTGWGKTHHNCSTLGTTERIITLTFYYFAWLQWSAVNKEGVYVKSVVYQRPTTFVVWGPFECPAGLPYSNTCSSTGKSRSSVAVAQVHGKGKVTNDISTVYQKILIEIFNFVRCVLHGIYKICPKHSQEYSSKSLIKIEQNQSLILLFKKWEFIYSA